MINLTKVPYNKLNSKQKENYNFHKVAAALAEYGYNSMRLNDDWQGADFISVHVAGDEMLKVQLKGRFFVAKKYMGKSIYIAFVENNTVKLYEHDAAITLLKPNIIDSVSWKDKGTYGWRKTPKLFDAIIVEL